LRQILQNLGTGETILAEVPAPALRPGYLLIRTEASLVSLGTEKMLVSFGRSGWLDKARSQPEKVRQVLDKIRTDGLVSTISAVRSKLDQPIPLGYSNVGVVLESAAGEFAKGDRVISNGPHAEVVAAPKHLCAKVPDGVTPEQAAFTVISAIGLQGIRLIAPTLGENIAVIGLGLIGLLTVQMLRANGARVLGIDFNAERCALAAKFGAEIVDLSSGADPVAAAQTFSGGRGMDGVVITASTESNDPVQQAARMCRKRGRIVLVGVVGLQLSRADFYEKELTFQVSCSYGPGRYDEAYELQGQDYPLGFVRWTEQRNFEAVLEMMRSGRLDPSPLISHRIPFKEALRAYAEETLNHGLAIILSYPAADLAGLGSGAGLLAHTVQVNSVPEAGGRQRTSAAPVVALIGAGNFTGRTLLPILKQSGAKLKHIVSATGVNAAHLARKFGFEWNTTDAAAAISDPSVDAVFITTRHNSHAHYVEQALTAGKRVYVEKPLCLSQEELESIRDTYQRQQQRGSAFLMVGFNRRFSPHARKMRDLLSGMSEPKTAIITVNAGALPDSHWTQTPEGGGRIVGEACHFLDLLRYLIGAPIINVQAMHVGRTPAMKVPEDKMTFTLRFADGSIGTVHYFANGHRAFPKERVQVFCGGRVLDLDNFCKLIGYGWPSFRKMNLWAQDKGHAAEVQAMVNALITGASAPIPFEEIVEVTQVTFDVVAAAAGAEQS
jgi:predicted dehydrogenase/threonine dehydrogenase-like Zn-dependent dehydrogenase